jgi:hypothetical protein
MFNDVEIHRFENATVATGSGDGGLISGRDSLSRFVTMHVMSKETTHSALQWISMILFPGGKWLELATHLHVVLNLLSSGHLTVLSPVAKRPELTTRLYVVLNLLSSGHLTVLSQ